MNNVRRWLEHTGEVELEIESDSEHGVFAEALAGLSELFGEPAVDDVARTTHRLVVRARDRASLLVGWLEELLWIAERDGIVPEGVVTFELDDDGLRAEVLARPGPPRPLVKAVTWHDLCFEPGVAGFHARVVFDV
jgi:SHS2 domain-containing protein